MLDGITFGIFSVKRTTFEVHDPMPSDSRDLKSWLAAMEEQAGNWTDFNIQSGNYGPENPPPGGILQYLILKKEAEKAIKNEFESPSLNGNFSWINGWRIEGYYNSSAGKNDIAIYHDSKLVYNTCYSTYNCAYNDSIIVPGFSDNNDTPGNDNPEGGTDSSPIVTGPGDDHNDGERANPTPAFTSYWIGAYFASRTRRWFRHDQL